MSAPAILVLDSGLGGLSVMSALREAIPDAAFIYAADTAGFPYGKRSIEDVGARADRIITAVNARHPIAMVVVACNTLSTLCLAGLRTRHALPFVGTVPAIKVAAEQSRTRRFTLLATPAAAASEYVSGLITEFAEGCVVDRIGAPNLALQAEALLLGEKVDDALIAADIAPCFVDDARGKTDTLLLGCTHYPFLRAHIEALAPWPVTFIDPAPAVARQAARLWNEFAPPPHSQGSTQEAVAYVTDNTHTTRYAPVFSRFGFAQTGSISL